jgi:alpha-beta hydrolase superfamily lysophospholipase
LDVDGISRDASVVAHYKADPLNYQGRMGARWAYETLRNMRLAAEQAGSGAVHWPLLLLQGDADRLVYAPGATLFFERASSADKTFRSFAGGYHELFHDSQSRDEALDALAHWLAERCHASAARAESAAAVPARESKELP